MHSMEDDRLHKIGNILETYFSDASLLWDKVMQSKIIADPKGMVSFESLSKLPKFKSIQATSDEIKAAAETYSLTKLQTHDDKISRIKPYILNKKQELDDYSIYVEGLSKPYDSEQSICELFQKLVGHVSFFRIPTNQQSQQRFFGYCFLEFDYISHVQKAVEVVNRYNRTSPPATIDEAQLKLIDKLNLRVMSKHEWNNLQKEYMDLLETRKRDIKQLWDNFYDNYPNGYDPHSAKLAKVEREEPRFVKGITVLVEGLHPHCPKTTAIALLQTSGVEIAFMNLKKKGLTFVHVRLRSPKDATQICEYFEQHPTVQQDKQDTKGKQVEQRSFECLKLRVLGGKEEEIYWETELN